MTADDQLIGVPDRQWLIASIESAVRQLGASRVDVQIMPAGHASVEVTLDSREDAAVLAQQLGLGELEHSKNDRNEWWRAERGDYGFARLLVVGGHRPLCACGARTGRAA